MDVLTLYGERLCTVHVLNCVCTLYLHVCGGLMVVAKQEARQVIKQQGAS